MPSNPNDRISRFTYKWNPDRIKEDLVAIKPEAVAKMTAIAPNQFDLERRLKALLASEGAVTAGQIAMYMAFTKHVARLVSVHEGGAQLNGEVALAIGTWKGRGYTEAILIRIRNELFSIPAPAAP